MAVTEEIAKENDLAQGIYIKEVMLESPAFEAGLQSGDVIVKMGGEEIYTVPTYESKVLELEPEEPIEIVVSRQGMDEHLRLKVMAGRLW